MKVLVAMDGSSTSEMALEWYFDQLHTPDNEVIIAHVAHQPTVPGSAIAAGGFGAISAMEDSTHSYSSVLIQRVIEETKAKVQAMKEKYAAICKERNAKHRLHFQIYEGKPGHGIVEFAEQDGVQLVVMGSRGHNAIRRMVLGSVSDHVVHHTNIPVIICPKELNK